MFANKNHQKPNEWKQEFNLNDVIYDEGDTLNVDPGLANRQVYFSNEKSKQRVDIHAFPPGQLSVKFACEDKEVVSAN